MSGQSPGNTNTAYKAIHLRETTALKLHEFVIELSTLFGHRIIVSDAVHMLINSYRTATQLPTCPKDEEGQCMVGSHVHESTLADTRIPLTNEIPEDFTPTC